MSELLTHAEYKAIAAEIDLPKSPFVDGKFMPGNGAPMDTVNPATGDVLATIATANADDVNFAVQKAREAFDQGHWCRMHPSDRKAILIKLVKYMTRRQKELAVMESLESGKPIRDCVEIDIPESIATIKWHAEAIDKIYDQTGPAGDDAISMIVREPIGVVAAVLPWNFPLLMLAWKIGPALAAGCSVIVKPAEETSMTALRVAELAHEAGLPRGVLQVLPGDGPGVGEPLGRHMGVDMVSFTGSTETAKRIQRQLAEKPGPIIPLIAETGGVNAMIVDATALPEQVTDDVVASAFQSAGQRCSALRVLYVQDDVADDMLKMIIGRAQTMKLGDPSLATTDIGPIIDDEARNKLARYAEDRDGLLWKGEAPEEGTFLAPHIFELGPDEVLKEEQFGPLLHVKRYQASGMDKVIDEIRSTGFGLTFGLHTRITEVSQRLAETAPAGNVYVNRNQIGANVGSQPFGGMGLSGTGPKAGGPHYLQRFAEERVISTNTAAAGGNASLIAMTDAE